MTRAEFIGVTARDLYSHLGANRDNYNNVYSYSTLLSASEAIKHAIMLADALEKAGQATWVGGE